MTQQKHEQVDYPNRFTARNEQGQAIQTRATNQDAYAKGWDMIFKKNKEEVK